MSLFSIWPQFGFRENPYDNEGLPGNDVGHQLLVGRDAEIGKVQRGIASGGAHPTVEGPAGIGKTSMLAVAGYRMLLASLEAEAGTLFLPANSFFQIGESQEEFESEVYRVVAQTMIDNAEAFRRTGLEVPDIEGLNKWLNDPQYRSGQVQAIGFGMGGGSEPNTSDGFLKSGFPTSVREQLARCFPGKGSGAIVCVCDNLELLQTSQRARETIELLRNLGLRYARSAVGPVRLPRHREPCPFRTPEWFLRYTGADRAVARRCRDRSDSAASRVLWRGRRLCARAARVIRVPVSGIALQPA